MSIYFPATYSTLNSGALAKFVSEKYKLGEASCKLLVRGVGDTYLVEDNSFRYIIRVYRSSHRSIPQIEEEINLLTGLKHNNVSVSWPIADSSGKYIQTLNAVEGDRYLVLFTFAPGKPAKLLTEIQLTNLGVEMARFHNVSSEFTNGGTRWNFDPETTLIQPLLKLKPALSDDPEIYSWLQDIVEQIVSKFKSIDSSGFSKGYCHFDFLPKNFHFNNDSITFFDFDFMGYGWLVNDIMTFWQHLVLDTYTGRMQKEAAREAYKNFLAAYREHRSVSNEELQTVPYLAIGFWLFYMGFHTTHDQFQTFAQTPHVKLYVGIMKHIVETYWKENAPS